MCAEPAPALDMDAVHAFAFKVIGDVTASQMDILNVIADRLGLFDHLAEAGTATSPEFADRAGIDERYAREWLSAMACHGYIAYDDASKSFSLPPERAFCLVDRDSPFYLGSMLSMAPTIGKLWDWWRRRLGRASPFARVSMCCPTVAGGIA